MYAFKEREREGWVCRSKQVIELSVIEYKKVHPLGSIEPFQFTSTTHDISIGNKYLRKREGK